MKNSQLYYDIKAFVRGGKLMERRMIYKVKHIVDERLVARRGSGKIVRRLFKIDHKSLAISGIGGPLPRNSVCKFVSFTTKYIGTRSSIRLPPNYLFNDFMSKQPSNSVFKNIWSKLLRDYRQVYTGGIQSNMINLLEMANDKIGVDLHYKSILKILDMGGFDWFRLPKMSDVKPEDLYNKIHINPDSSPGLYTKELFGGKRRKSILSSVHVSDVLFKIFSQQGFGNWTLWEMLGREKDVKVNDSNKELRTRLVLNMEEPMMILNFLSSQKITTLLSNDKTNNIFIGKSLVNEDIQFLTELEKRYDVIVEADWTSFDNFVSKPLIHLATSIIMSLYDFKDINKHYFIFVYHSFINKYVAVPPGLVYKISKGIPSGHPFTSLIGSIVNIILWAIIGYHVYGDDYSQKMYPVVSGDDCYIYMTYVPELKDTIETICEHILRMKIKDLKLFCSMADTDIHDRPSLLRRKFNSSGNIVWDRESVIKKLMYPPSRRVFVQDQLDVVCNYLYTAPFDFELNELLTSYIRYLCATRVDLNHSGVYESYIKDMITRGIFRISNKSEMMLTNLVINDLIPKYDLNNYIRMKVKAGEFQNLITAVFFYIPMGMWRNYAHIIINYIREVFKTNNKTGPPI